MDKHLVIERLGFAERRLKDLLALDLPSNPAERQQLTQEFFFHLVGAIDMTAQLVNDTRNLIADQEDVSLPNLAAKLGTDPIRSKIDWLYVNPNKAPLPLNHYTDAAYIYRIYNYRHQVTHRGANAFQFNLPEREAALIIDPRDIKHSFSQRT